MQKRLNVACQQHGKCTVRRAVILQRVALNFLSSSCVFAVCQVKRRYNEEGRVKVDEKRAVLLGVDLRGLLLKK